MSMVEVKILFFGKARELANVEEAKVCIPTTNMDAL